MSNLTISGVSAVANTFAALSGTLTASTQMTGSVLVANGGTQLTTITAGQVLVGNSGNTFTATTLTASQNMTASSVSGAVVFTAPLQGEKIIGYATAATFTATGDTLLTMNPSLTNSYIIRRVTLANPTSTSILTAASGSLRTASAGGGTAIVTAFVLTGLTATNGFLDQTIASASTTFTAQQLFFNVTTATATADTFQLFCFGEALGG